MVDFTQDAGTVNAISSEKTVSLAHSLLILAALAAILLAGGPTEGGMGIFLATAGVVLLLVPPKRSIPWLLWLLGGLLLISATASFIPQGWIGSSGVRDFIRPVPILELPQSITLNPRATIFWIVVLGLSLLIFFYTLSSDLNLREMENLALLAVLGCCFYALLALKAWQTGWHYPFFERLPWGQPAFGFFPNRNHTAGFLITGALLSLGLIHRGMSGRQLIRPLIGACAFALISSILLFTSVSRGGLLFLAVGFTLWILGLGRHLSRSFFLGCGVLVVSLAVLFFTSGSDLLIRVTKGDAATLAKTPAGPQGKINTGPQEAPSESMRVKIWRDTCTIIEDYPFTGTGLGTYALVYPFYANQSLRDQSTALHPESDWLMLCAEEGIPSLAISLMGLIFLLVKIPHLATQCGRVWPLRWAFVVAFMTELLHGLVDVPIHKPELGWWIVLLGGIGLSSTVGGKTQSSTAPKHNQRILFMIGGLGAVVMGIAMIRAQWWNGAPLPPFAPEFIEKKIVELYGKGDPFSEQRAIQTAQVGIREYPMRHQFYYQLAEMLLIDKIDVLTATQLLEAEQAVSPNDPDFVFTAGWLLSPYAPMTSATFWNEALRRQLAYDASPNSAIHRSGDLYQQMIGTALGNWPLFDRLPALASNKEFRLIWLNNSYCNAQQTTDAVRDHSFMSQLSTKEQAEVIHLWWERGDKKDVEQFINEHPEYETAFLGTRLAMLASQGRAEEACKLLIKRFKIPSSELNDEISSTISSPKNDVPEDALEAALLYRKLGNELAARDYLEKAMAGPKKTEALRLRALLEMRSGEWVKALADLTEYLQAKGRF